MVDTVESTHDRKVDAIESALTAIQCAGDPEARLFVCRRRDGWCQGVHMCDACYIVHPVSDRRSAREICRAANQVN